MESEEKIEYFCITSSNEFKIMDDMHRALVLDNFQKLFTHQRKVPTPMFSILFLTK